MIARRAFRSLVKGYQIKKDKDRPDVGVDTIKVQKMDMERPKVEGGEGEKKKEEPEKEQIDGIEIPTFRSGLVRLSRMEADEERLRTIIYPLIPTEPKKGEPIFAYAKIEWDEKTHKYMYHVIEPQLSPRLKEISDKIKDLLEQRLDVDFSKLRKFEALEYLGKQTDDLLKYFDMHITPTEREILRYYVERDFVGLGKIQPFMKDENIEDISCDGVGIPIFVFHRNPKIGSIMTSVKYDTADELDSFITRLVQLTGKSISMAEPLVDGTLPTGSRLQATLATDIARRGSNFTIRKFTKTPLTPIHLLGHNTIDVRLMAYFWMLIEQGFSVIVSGGTASGKTTLLNAMSLFIRPDKKIVSIEDTAELQLPHPHWVPTVARTAVAEKRENRRGDVDLFDLLRESFRQRPDYIIVGEVRGREAYILFQQMATGHPSLSTIHAENMPKLIDRLTTPPISLPSGLMDSMDIAIFLARMRYKNNFVRRVTEVVEMVRYDSERKEPVTNSLFKWNSLTDKFDLDGKSVILKKIQKRTGMTDKEIQDELERRMALLSWMEDRNILDYQSVNKVINLYYNYPQRTMALIMNQLEEGG